jgi:hypothetical protein
MSDVPSSPPPPKPLIKVITWLTVLLVVVAGVSVLWMSQGNSAVREQAISFINDMSAGNFAGAKARCTPEIDLELLQREADRMKAWGGARNISRPSSTTRTLPDGRIHADVASTVEFGNGQSRVFTATMNQQPDGTYRITIYKFE